MDLSHLNLSFFVTGTLFDDFYRKCWFVSIYRRSFFFGPLMTTCHCQPGACDTQYYLSRSSSVCRTCSLCGCQSRNIQLEDCACCRWWGSKLTRRARTRWVSTNLAQENHRTLSRRTSTAASRDTPRPASPSKAYWWPVEYVIHFYCFCYWQLTCRQMPSALWVLRTTQSF